MLWNVDIAFLHVVFESFPAVLDFDMANNASITSGMRLILKGSPELQEDQYPLASVQSFRIEASQMGVVPP
jgi:hypothetical protein